MFDVGFWELLVISVLALLILGPERLPGAIRSVARTVRNIKGMASSFKTEIDEQLRIHELHENLKKAESLNMQNLSPELEQSVNELKAAAQSVREPYQVDKVQTKSHLQDQSEINKSSGKNDQSE